MLHKLPTTPSDLPLPYDSGTAVSKPWSVLVADPKHGPLPALLLGLTVVTGLVDAVSVLSLGRVFVANMTGNVVFVGFALAGAPGFSLSASLFACWPASSSAPGQVGWFTPGWGGTEADCCSTRCSSN